MVITRDKQVTTINKSRFDDIAEYRKTNKNINFIMLKKTYNPKLRFLQQFVT
ncbi:hypothetical protein PAUR_a2747 [Pseudoalteromonas aurantia 208]|uniref:Uncharacterized protein n=1 Tax=Pseudoalteromonas aurantia 208 TaxID=1314867 RepID=A0ABR9EDC6_9GAMM|nr:hypothetical protein [Pseudoalteromonas aurantia 208]